MNNSKNDKKNIKKKMKVFLKVSVGSDIAISVQFRSGRKKRVDSGAGTETCTRTGL
jgi:hypothetical protein